MIYWRCRVTFLALSPEAEEEAAPDRVPQPGRAVPTRGDEPVASRLELRRLRDVPSSHRRPADQVPDAELTGALGLSLVARPAYRTVWTLSAWQDPAALQAATGRQPHADHDAIPAAHRWLQLRHLDSPGHGPAHRMGRGAAPPA